MKRLIDLALTLVASTVLLVPIALVALAVRLTSRGPVLYWSDRVGRNNQIFKMPKFRSMRINTPALATHLLTRPEQYLTPIGGFLRKRPALFNQADLISLRTQAGVHTLVPGLTGWAQINGRDELPIPDKVALDVQYLQRQSVLFDLRIIALTALKVLRREGVTH